MDNGKRRILAIHLFDCNMKLRRFVPRKAVAVMVVVVVVVVVIVKWL